MAKGEKTFLYLDLGTLEYEKAYELQKKLVEARTQKKTPDLLILLEHLPVFTITKTTQSAHLLAPLSTIKEKGIAIFETNRGGDITYHGPGQLVGYVIMDLSTRGKDLHQFVRDLEQLLIDTLLEWGIHAYRLAEHRGVWVGNKKIAAIGIAVNHQWVTMHGFSLNIDPDYEHFSMIIPCGIKDKGITSMKKILEDEVNPEKLKEVIVKNFEKTFWMRGKKADLGEIICWQKCLHGSE